MGFLSDFGGAFFTGMGNQMMQQEEDERVTRLQEALERRRRRTQNEDEIARLGAQGPQLGVDDTGAPAVMRVRGEVDPTTGAASYTRERLADAPDTYVRRETRKTSEGTVTGSVIRTKAGEVFKPDGAPLPPRTPVGRQPPKPRTTRGGDGLMYEERGPGEPWAPIPGIPAKTTNGKAVTPANTATEVRARVTPVVSEFKSLETQEEKDELAARVGLPGGLSTAEFADLYRQQQQAQVAREWGGSTPGAADGKKAPGSSAANPIDAASTSAPVKGKWYRKPNGTVFQA